MDHREWARIAGDPAAVRSIARFVAATLGDGLSAHQRDFVAELQGWTGPEPLSIRAREWLDSLRSRATRRATVRGFRASTLVEKLWALRLDLSEDAEEFVCELHDQIKQFGANLALSNGQWRYVFALCHEVGLIEKYVSIE
jgi:hypothetical protein